MKITARSAGVTTEHDIKQPVPPHPGRDQSGVTCVLAHNNIKVDAPDAYKISSDETIQCMKDMSQKAWEHISTGPLFQHFFNTLFKDSPMELPTKIEDLLEEDRGTIHACGLIIMLVEARFDGRKEVFLRTPEDFMHPGMVYHLMSVILDIQKIPMGGGEPDMLVDVMGPA